MRIGSEVQIGDSEKLHETFRGQIAIVEELRTGAVRVKLLHCQQCRLTHWPRCMAHHWVRLTDLTDRNGLDVMLDYV